MVNLHKDQAAKLQAKNQQELDLLDDIRNFMKQKAALEKNYAEGLLKLSSVYGTKKIAALPSESHPSTRDRALGLGLQPHFLPIYTKLQRLIRRTNPRSKRAICCRLLIPDVLCRWRCVVV